MAVRAFSIGVATQQHCLEKPLVTREDQSENAVVACLFTPGA